MLGDMRAVLLAADAGPSVALLQTWMIGCQTASAKLRAGLPSTWRAGNKTGNGANGSTNDIAILWPPGRAPVLVTSYYTGSTAAPAARDTVHADIGRLVAEQFA
jgi:beta-lactamase class A